MPGKKTSGFTLIQLAIVLIIIGILTGGLLSVAQMQIDSAKLQQTNSKLDKIARALQLFYQANGYLPCPADGTIAYTSSTAGNYGKSLTSTPAAPAVPALNNALSDVVCSSMNATISTNTYIGVVPTRTLDLPDSFMVDAWDNRITYAVSKHCADPDNWVKLGSVASDALSPYGCVAGPGPVSALSATGGTITIKDNAGNSRPSLAAYVVISHGNNGLGAYSKQAGTRKITVPASLYSAHEADNASLAGNGGANSYDAIFRDSMPLVAPGSANYFDDMLRWRTGAQMEFDKENNR